MLYKRVFNSPLIMSWLNLLLKYGIGILLLPVATYFLNTEELAYFLFINTVLGLAYLAEGGINRSILRAMAYYVEGVEELPQNINDISKVISKKVNYIKIGQLIKSSFLLYVTIGLLSVIILNSFGLVLSLNILESQPNRNIAFLSFFLLSVYSFIYLLSLRWVGLIQGIGRLANQKQIEAIMGISKIFLIVIALLLNTGVLGTIVAMIINIFTTYLIYKHMFFKFFPKEKITQHYSFNSSIIISLWPSIWKQSLLAWGSYFILQGTSLVVAQIPDSSLIASYLLTLQIIGLIMKISNAPSLAYYPRVASFIAKKDINQYRKMIEKSLYLAFIVYCLSVMFIILFGNDLLSFINSNTYLLPNRYLILISIIYLLELNHTIHATYYTATNHIPFVLPSLISGILIFGLSISFVESWGIIGILLIRFFVQLSCNNWYPIYLNRKLIRKIKTSLV